MSKDETPLTDAIHAEYLGAGHNSGAIDAAYRAMFKLARTLERDRADLLASLKSLIGLADAHTKRLERECQSTEFSAGISEATTNVTNARALIARLK